MPPAALHARPRTLWIVRHGQSAGNVAREQAEARGLQRVELSIRDVDVPLSDLGVEQAVATGRWFGALPPGERPTVVLASPYVRAQTTAAHLLQHAGLALPVLTDERLREKDVGVTEGLTRAGILALFPDQVGFRRLLGKFYHRTPGGESWCDVALRVRAALDEIYRDFAGERVLLVAHQVVVLCARYVVERLTEAALLAIDREGDVANCSITEYRRDDGAEAGPRGGLALVRYNVVDHLAAQRAPVTESPDVPDPQH
ncbi:MAG: histidine phosphatase family protein [Myxococcales bacterium]|nr:histidine phosphatase family protein [Myxococcales bacterium]